MFLNYLFPQDEQILSGVELYVTIGLAAAILVFLLISLWFVLKKMGKPGWMSLIPFYNVYILFEKCWESKYFYNYLITSIIVAVISIFFGNLTEADGLLYWAIMITELIVGIYQIILGIRLCIMVAKSFNYPSVFGFGLYFLDAIFFAILAFSKAKFTKEKENNNTINNQENINNLDENNN